jgi:hypothetical protein
MLVDRDYYGEKYDELFIQRHTPPLRATTFRPCTAAVFTTAETCDGEEGYAIAKGRYENLRLTEQE